MIEPQADRPTVIVHMTSSVDGRIQTKRWSRYEAGSHYEDVHMALAGDAWMCGRITMRGYTRGTAADDADMTPVERVDHIAKTDASGFAVALDAHGRLHWGWRNDIEGDHVVVVLLESVGDAHLNALRASAVSYLFAGRDRIDFVVALRKLKEHFDIRRLLVEGGGGINGSMLTAGVVDEISLLLAPAVDGGRGVPAVFDYDVTEGEAPAKNCELALKTCDVLPDGMVRLHYLVTSIAA